MTATTVQAIWRERPAVALVVLGLVSGLLSAFIGVNYEFPILWPVGWVFALDHGPVPIGVFFAGAMALGLYQWSRNVWVPPVVFLATMYGWSAAIHTAIRVQRNVGDDAHLIAASVLAGAIGAGLTHLGAAAFIPELRRPARIAITCAVGAVVGLLFLLGERRYIDARVLYVVWQPAVAFAIGMGLGASRAGDPSPRQIRE